MGKTMMQESGPMGSKFDRGVSMASASAAASTLVRQATARGRSRMNAYRSIGAKIGMSASWVRKLIAGTVRGVDAELKQQLDDLLIRELEAELAVHRSLDAMDAGAYVISHRRTGFLVGLAELRFNTVGEALRVAEKLESSYHWRKLKPNGLSAPTGWPKSTARRQQLRKFFASAAMWP